MTMLDRAATAPSLRLGAIALASAGLLFAAFMIAVWLGLAGR